ncbi:MAG TPA: DUF1932 domain-containing protein [Gammaproteobacteria bacterium]|jgi:3-hydroxyisobutyrate dehydrogenase-like beta-hydroxyacid dehydrogenase
MTKTIGIIGTGDMGSAVGAALGRSGYRVVTDLTGRSAASRALAARAGVEDLGSLATALDAADLFLSIVPPAAAVELARRVRAALGETRKRPVFVDCNAVAPATLRSIAALFAGAGVTVADVGIIGPAPRQGAAPTRFYVSGEGRARLLALEIPELAVIDMGPEVGRASAIKMTYAAMNKGTDALYTAVLMAAEELGVRAELMAEFHESQTQAAERMAARIPYLAATAARFTGEMREIAATFAAAGVTPEFHRGAEWVYATLARTPLAAETRATLPKHRSLDEALAVFRTALPKQ